jgi:YgiT-type zinc finger domain-containing protein
MKCVVCRNGETAAGTTTITLERGDAVLVVRGVPARVCRNCGEEYLDEQEVRRLQALLDESAKPGVRIEMRDYLAA